MLTQCKSTHASTGACSFLASMLSLPQKENLQQNIGRGALSAAQATPSHLMGYSNGEGKRQGDSINSLLATGTLKKCNISVFQWKAEQQLVKHTAAY